VRVFILTGNRRGSANLALPALMAAEGVEVAGVVLSSGAPKSRQVRALKRWRKVRNIGLRAAIVGHFMRDWFRDKGTEDIEALCERLGVPVLQTGVTNSEETASLIRRLDPDLGISCDTGFIGPPIFNIPQHGMINTHGELLPKYRGAQGIIWPIHDGATETGLTVHRVSAEVLGGDILYQERVPILFGPSLRDTVLATNPLVRARLPGALVHVCQHFEELVREATPQGPGRTYTTPTWDEYAKMQRRNAHFYDVAG
jgi:methionyl-tRNA formyltransferase